jgi:Tfp pilus assembly protein PilO
MKTNKSIIYILCGLFALSLLFCLFSFAYSSIESVSAQSLQSELQEYEKKEKEAVKVEAVHKRWQNIHNEFQQFKTEFLMKMDDFSQFRDQLKMMFSKNQLALQGGVRYSYKRIFSSDIYKVDVGFTLVGSYTNIKRFIHEVLNQKKLVLLKSFDLDRGKLAGEIAGKFAMEVYLAK